MGEEKRQNSWLNSKVESALEVENPEEKNNKKHLLAQWNSIVASWAVSNSSALQPRSSISRCQPLFPAFLPNLLNLSPCLHPLISLIIHLPSLYWVPNIKDFVLGINSSIRQTISTPPVLQCWCSRPEDEWMMATIKNRDWTWTYFKNEENTGNPSWYKGFQEAT